jgi:hypothetical protein
MARVCSWKAAKRFFFSSYGPLAIEVGRKLFGVTWMPERATLAQLNEIGGYIDRLQSEEKA